MCAEVNGATDVVATNQGTLENDGNVFPTVHFLNHFAKGPAVHVGEFDIEENQVGTVV